MLLLEKVILVFFFATVFIHTHFKILQLKEQIQAKKWWGKEENTQQHAGGNVMARGTSPTGREQTQELFQEHSPTFLLQD